jgi:DNA-binding NarL/FixJ family response regulator
LEKLAEASSLQSRFRPAAIIFGATSALRASVGSAMDAADRPAYERTISRIRTKLGEEAFAAAWAEGRALTVEVAADFALSEPAMSTGQSEQDSKEKFGGLTKREREVAVLIAQGKSNREIARAMTVGVKTIETYVTRMLSKLGFDSRVQIATWTIQKGFGERIQNEPG